MFNWRRLFHWPFMTKDKYERDIAESRDVCHGLHRDVYRLEEALDKAAIEARVNRVAVAIEVIDTLSCAITKRGSGFPMIWKYPAGNEAAEEATRNAIERRLKEPTVQIMMPVIQEMPSIELQSATDISLTTQERDLYRQAIAVVSNYLKVPLA